MTEEIICRYKFQNNEKFNGKEYCTLFNEVCSDVEFVCDKNCQVYEDYKQLKRLEQENKALNFKINQLKANSLYNDLTGIELSAKVFELKQENKALKDNNNHLQAIIDDGRAENKRFREENKELKERFEKRGELMCNCAKQREKYRSALEEINITVKQLLKGVSSNCINNTPYLTALSLIENKINECLGE